MEESPEKANKINNRPITSAERKERASVGANAKWNLYRSNLKYKEEIYEEMQVDSSLHVNINSKSQREKMTRERNKADSCSSSSPQPKILASNCSPIEYLENKYNLRKRGPVSHNIFHFRKCHFCGKEKKTHTLIDCQNKNCNNLFCEKCFNKIQKENGFEQTYQEALESNSFICFPCNALCQCTSCVNTRIKQKIKQAKVAKELKAPIFQITRVERPTKKQIFMPLEVSRVGKKKEKRREIEYINPFLAGEIGEIDEDSNHIPNEGINENEGSRNNPSETKLPIFSESLSQLPLISPFNIPCRPHSTPISQEDAQLLLQSSSKHIEEEAAANVLHSTLSPSIYPSYIPFIPPPMPYPTTSSIYYPLNFPQSISYETIESAQIEEEEKKSLDMHNPYKQYQIKQNC